MAERFIGLFTRAPGLHIGPIHDVWVDEQQIAVGTGPLLGVRVSREQVVYYDHWPLWYQSRFWFFGDDNWVFVPLRGRTLLRRLRELRWEVERWRGDTPMRNASPPPSTPPT